MELSFFNPRGQDEDAFVAEFVARQKELNFFLKQLELLPATHTPQHYLIVAPRGFGKTSLLRRIGIALMREPSYKSRYIPLSFREEQHNVISLDVLWRNCIESLQETLAQEGADEATIDALSDLFDQLAPRKQLPREQQDGEPAARALMDYCERLGRRPVLLIDNLDTLLEGLSTQHQWHWRSKLQAPDAPVLIAAASKYPNSMREHDAAFYDFFRIQSLQALDDVQVMQCLRHYAQLRGEQGKAVLRQIDTNPGKIIALNAMAGGNPRTLKVLYSVLESQFSADIVQQLREMLDKFTGWYQARTEELALQTRAVFDAVALHWDPITAAELSDITGLEVTVINSQLSRLEKLGYVEPVKLSSSGKGRSGYQLGERFYNIWYLMRHGSVRIGRRVRFLTAFIQSMFSSTERRQLGQQMLQQSKPDSTALLAMAHSVRGADRQRLLTHARNSYHGTEQEKAELESEIAKLQKPARAKRQSGQPAREVDEHHSFISAFNQTIDLRESGHYEEAEAAYRRAIALDEKNAWPWNGLGNLLQTHLARYDEAEAAYRRAIALDEKNAWPWNGLGDLLQTHLARYDEAEAAYRRAIALDEKYAGPWNGLGNLLQDHLSRYDEAEAAYRRAIALDEKNAWPWNGLGNLLQTHLARYDEAEAAYRRAIALDEKYAGPWNGLGSLLQDHLGRLDEAVQAYASALACDADLAAPHANLAYLYALRLQQPEEAQVHIDKAIALQGLSSAGRLLLQALQEIPKGAQAVWQVWHQAISSDDGSLYMDYLDDLQRWLIWWLATGHGAWLVQQMQAHKYSEQYAPLYHATVALVEGPDHLLRINPETRRFAQSIEKGVRQMLLALPPRT